MCIKEQNTSNPFSATFKYFLLLKLQMDHKKWKRVPKQTKNSNHLQLVYQQNLPNVKFKK